MDIKKRYRNIIKIPIEFERVPIRPYIPVPTEEEYKTGYIRRYFIQRTNDKNSVVYEVSQTAYENISQNSLYNVVSLSWKISGEIEEVKSINAKCVKYASKTLPALTLYLPNLLQFKKMEY
jgi:hypothetical protein